MAHNLNSPSKCTATSTSGEKLTESANVILLNVLRSRLIFEYNNAPEKLVDSTCNYIVEKEKSALKKTDRKSMALDELLITQLSASSLMAEGIILGTLS